LALAAQILTPDSSCVVSIEREQALDGDVTHVDARLSRIGIAWVTVGEFPPADEPPDPLPIVQPGQRPMFPVHLPHPLPHPRPRQSPSERAAHTYPGEELLLDASQGAAPGGSHPIVSPDKMFVGQMPGKPNDVTRMDLTQPYRPAPKPDCAPPKPVEATSAAKNPLFLLRVLQLQDPDGSWSDEKSLGSFCGFAIPADSQGLERVMFLTAFVIVCLRLKGKDEEDKWELVAEKGMTFLRESQPSIVWDDVLKSIEAHLLAL
jgi:hypothetical protein